MAVSGYAAWLCVAGLFSLLCVFLAFGGCCLYNQWYLRHGPFRGLTHRQICPKGKRISRPVRILAAWCCPRLVSRPMITPPRPAAVLRGPVGAYNDMNVVSHLDVLSDIILSAIFAPPSYDEALGMRRPEEGENVILRHGADGTIFTFKMSRDMNCEPPVYMSLTDSTDQSQSLVTDSTERSQSVVTDSTDRSQSVVTGSSRSTMTLSGDSDYSISDIIKLSVETTESCISDAVTVPVEGTVDNSTSTISSAVDTVDTSISIMTLAGDTVDNSISTISPSGDSLDNNSVSGVTISEDSRDTNVCSIAMPEILEEST